MSLEQENMTCNTWGNGTEYRQVPMEEDLSRVPQLVSVSHAKKPRFVSLPYLNLGPSKLVAHLPGTGPKQL